MFRDVARAVIVAAVLGLAGTAGKMYMDLHDVKKAQEEEKGKIEWLYKYIFHKDDNR